MTTRTIQLSGRSIAYTLKRSARRRTIGFRVGPQGLSVSVPRWAGRAETEAALREKSGWILEKLDKWAARPSPQPLLGVSGERIGYLGRELVLDVIAHDRARSLVAIEDEILVVRIDGALAGDLASATVRRALDRWRRAQALALMAPKLERYAQALGLKPPAVSVRVNSGRWGSCSADGSIRMNARLVAYPEPLVDYVCAHEACHLLEMNHGPRFYALLDGLMPDHRARSKALKAAVAPGAVF
ncbi:M48 family metallopeptidase [Marinicauda algicola]|nr:SprT family zinc-dependent metalloprotease [Marinicauda algicola]